MTTDTSSQVEIKQIAAETLKVPILGTSPLISAIHPAGSARS